MAEQYYDVVDIFEQQSDLGGVWNYDSSRKPGRTPVPQTSPHQPLESPIWSREVGSKEIPSFSNPMYDGLETNIPDVLMKHSDDASLLNHQLFPRREEVLQYLRHYGMKIAPSVRFNTQVVDARLTNGNSLGRWKVSYRNVRESRIDVNYYDALIVASGHYAVPYLPAIPGIAEWNTTYPGVISHSKFYQNPSPYKDKKTLVVGYAASGVDITLQISSQARLPIIVSRRSVSYLSHPASYIKDVPEIAEFVPPSQGSQAVRLIDGRVEADVDAVLFCTGYFYSYPFLSSLIPPLVTSGMQVEQLYKHMFWMNDPTLAFVGLPSRVIPFRTFEGQASVIAKVWANRIPLPEDEEMRKWYKDDFETSDLGKPHVMDHPKDFQYHNDLVVWASESNRPDLGLMSLPWLQEDFHLRERFPAIKRAFNDKGKERHSVKAVEELGFQYSSRNSQR